MEKFIFDRDLYEDIKSGTNIVAGDEYRQTIMAISELAAQMVVKTLGPYGQTTIVDDSEFTYPTKDGWNVLKRLRFNDPIYNNLYTVIKQVSFDLVNKVGDATTSASIGANEFMKKIMAYQETHDFRQTDFLDMLNEISAKIIATLKDSKYVHYIDHSGDFSDIRTIADIASNNNEVLSNIIQKIYQETNNPHIYVTLDSGNQLSSDIQNGFKLDCKTLNHKAYMNDDDGTCKKNERTLIAVFDHNVTYNEHGAIITSLSRYANAKKMEIIILAPHFDDIMTNIIGTTINSFLQQHQIPNIMLIQVPLSMDIHRQYLSDVVLLTNAQVFDYGKVRAFNVMIHNAEHPEEEKIEDALLNVEQYHFESPQDIIDICIGKADKLIISDRYMIIQDYENIVNPDQYKNTLAEVEANYLAAQAKANKSSTHLFRDYMDSYLRYTKLSGKMGIIKVGGVSELAKHCLKDSVDDAVLACRSAYTNGYIRGLNLTTLKIIDDILDEVYEEDLEYDILHMLSDVFTEMSMYVLRNKYDDDQSRIVTNITTHETDLLCNADIISLCVKNDLGYNLVTESFEPEATCTVINSVSTDVEIINAMISVLSIMLTSNQFLSVNRMYDRKMGRKQLLDSKIADKVAETEALTTTILTTIERYSDTKKDESGIFTGLAKWFGNIFR